MHVENILNGMSYYDEPTYSLTEREVNKLVKELLSKSDVVGVDTIPMSGANR